MRGQVEIERIHLDAHQKSDLRWPYLEKELDGALGVDRPLSFEFDFKMEGDSYNFFDQIGFFSLSIAIAEFNKRIAPRCHERIGEICLYRGNGDFSKAVLRHKGMFEAFHTWRGDVFGNAPFEAHQLRLFSIKILLEYLHRLSSSLPEDAPLFVRLDLSDVERPVHLSELMSLEFYPCIQAIVEAKWPIYKGDEASIGLVLPPIGSSYSEEIDRIMRTLYEVNLPFRMVPENLMIELWNGIDDLIVLSDAMSKEGIRMLRGFNAASGNVVVVGKSLDLNPETSLDTFLLGKSE